MMDGVVFEILADFWSKFKYLSNLVPFVIISYWYIIFDLEYKQWVFWNSEKHRIRRTEPPFWIFVLVFSVQIKTFFTLGKNGISAKYPIYRHIFQDFRQTRLQIKKSRSVHMQNFYEDSKSVLVFYIAQKLG